MTNKELKAAEKLVERTYYKVCQNTEIDIMDIGKVFKAGVKLLADGASPAKLEAELPGIVAGINQAREVK